jgi:hypothetical protein
MVEKTEFNGLEAVRIDNAKGDELVILTELGPRIISFKPEGKENFFYVDEKNLNKKNADSSEWFVYGGTRLWISPECPATYAPDNVAVQASLDDQCVTITAPDESTSIKKTLKVQAEDQHFTITYSILNDGSHLLTAGIWALSCIEPGEGSVIHLPWGEGSEWDVKDMKYWRSWLGVGSDIESKQWRPTNEFFIINPTGETGKVGFTNRHGFALFQRGDLSFIKKSPFIESAVYPDDGCNFEIYTSSIFYEIETLSPLYCLKPGVSYSHVERWWAGFESIDTSTIQAAKSSVDRLF